MRGRGFSWLHIATGAAIAQSPFFDHNVRDRRCHEPVGMRIVHVHGLPPPTPPDDPRVARGVIIDVVRGQSLRTDRRRRAACLAARGACMHVV